MRLYILRYSQYTKAVVSILAPNFEEVKKFADYWTRSGNGWTYIAIPNSCIKKVYGYCTWEGEKSWPANISLNLPLKKELNV